MENCATCTAADAYVWDYALALVGDRIKTAAEMEASPMRNISLRRYAADLKRLLNQTPVLPE